MALTGAELVDEVQAYTGRPDDTVLVTSARVTRWLNDGMKDIAEKCPGIPDLEFKNTESIDFTTDGISYSIADLTFGTPGDSTAEAALYIWKIWHVDGANSIPLDFQPQDEFDEALIDPTSSDHSADRPTRWTRRGNYIEIAPRCASAYDADTMRIDGMRYPQEFTADTTSVSEIPNCDEGLIYYATAKAWAAIGTPESMMKSQLWKKKYSNPEPLPGEDYGWLEEFRDKYTRMDAWEGNILFDSEY